MWSDHLEVAVNSEEDSPPSYADGSESVIDASPKTEHTRKNADGSTTQFTTTAVAGPVPMVRARRPKKD